MGEWRMFSIMQLYRTGPRPERKKARDHEPVLLHQHIEGRARVHLNTARLSDRERMDTHKHTHGRHACVCAYVCVSVFVCLSVSVRASLSLSCMSLRALSVWVSLYVCVPLRAYRGHGVNGDAQRAHVRTQVRVQPHRLAARPDQQ
jgi:hypothetical protein